MLKMLLGMLLGMLSAAGAVLWLLLPAAVDSARLLLPVAAAKLWLLLPAAVATSVQLALPGVAVAETELLLLLPVAVAVALLLQPVLLPVPAAELLPAVMQLLRLAADSRAVVVHGRPISGRYSGNGAFLTSFHALYPTW